MRTTTIYRDLNAGGSRLGFYTSESRESIPEQSGCYAWILPLWMYRDDLRGLLEIVGNLLGYESAPEAELTAHFARQDIFLTVHPQSKSVPTATKTDVWDDVIADPESREALQRTLLEASLFLPPLYVGMTDNLKRRYLEHTGRVNPRKNTFHSRLSRYAEVLGLKVSVNDLVFASIATSADTSFLPETVRERQYNELVEQILMQLCRPPFSER